MLQTDKKERLEISNVPNNMVSSGQHIKKWKDSKKEGLGGVKKKIHVFSSIEILESVR